MSTIAVNAITDANGGNTTSINNTTPNAYNTVGKNLIINGAMRIDQRNSGSAFTMTSDSQYAIDRFKLRTYGGSGRFSTQQSSTAPAGFDTSALLTVTTTENSGSYGYAIGQRLEGNTIAHLNWGTADAKDVTLSFWVRSSLTGTYCASFRTFNGTYSYVSEFTISSANTWEKKTITVTGPTVGTWSSDNTGAVIIDFTLGSQTSKETATTDSWHSGNYVSTSNQADWMGTTSNTFYITGVQLEVGSVATEFERRPYGTELQLCQRYYFSTYPDGIAVGSTSQEGSAMYGICVPNQMFGGISYPTTMRTSPTVTVYHPSTGTSGQIGNYADGATSYAVSGTRGSEKIMTNITSSSTISANTGLRVHIVATAEL